MRLILTLMFLALVALVAVALFPSNSQPVTVYFYFGTVEGPLGVVVAVTLLVGALWGGSMNLLVMIGQRRKIAKLKSTLKKIERQTAPSRAAVKDAG